MKRWQPLTLFILLAALLAACSQPQSGPGPLPQTPDGLSEEAVVAALRGFIDDVASVEDPELLEAALAAAQAPIDRPGCPAIAAFLDPDDFAAMPQSLTTLSGTVLARGSYQYDPFADECSFAADTDKLVLRYPYLTFDDTGYDTEYDTEYDTGDKRVAEAEVIIDWGSDTLDVLSPQGDLVEVPRNMNATLSVDGQQVADLDASLSWYAAPECGPGILEPTSLMISGQVGSLHLREVGFELTEDSFRLRGELEAEAGLSSAFDFSVQGELKRGPCFSESFQADTGALAFSLESSLGEDDRSLALSVNLRDPVFEDFPDVSYGGFIFGEVRGLTSVTLEDGLLKLDGKKAAWFSGALDDSNQNGVSGENVTVSFAGGGSTTLEAFLTENDFGLIPLPPFGE